MGRLQSVVLHTMQSCVGVCMFVFVSGFVVLWAVFCLLKRSLLFQVLRRMTFQVTDGLRFLLVSFSDVYFLPNVFSFHAIRLNIIN